jgi:hypothetical protein
MSDFKGFGKGKIKGLGRKTENGSHSHYSLLLDGNGAKKLLKEFCTVSKEELTAKYGDLSQMSAYILDGGDE